MAESLARTLQCEQHPHLLIVTEQTDGLRQTYLQQGRVILSRFIPKQASLQNLPALVDALSQTCFYLQTVKHLSSDTALRVMLVSLPHAALINADGISIEAEVRRRGLPLQCDAATWQSIGLATVTSCGVTNDPEMPWLLLCAQSLPAFNLAPPASLSAWKQFQRLVLLQRSAAGLLLFGLLVSLIAYGVSQHYSQRAHALQQQTQLLQRDYHAAQQQLPHALASASTMQAAVEDINVLRIAQAPSIAIQELWHMINQHVMRQPQIRLQKLIWENLSPSSNAVQLRTTITADLLESDHRRAIAYIQQLQIRLTQLPQISSVRVIEWPLNLNPEQSLIGNVMDGAVAAERMRFSVQMEHHSEITHKP